MNIKRVITVLGLSLLLTACGNGGDSGEASKTGTATAKGYGGDIEITVKLDDSGKIIDIERKSEETDKVGEVALDELTEKLKGKDSTADLEAVSGATVSSEAFIKAVDEAIAKAQ